MKNAERSSIPPPKPAEQPGTGLRAGVVLPWAIAVVCAAAAAGLWLTRPSPEEAAAPAGSAADGEPGPEGPATAGAAAERAERRRLEAALRDCRVELEAARDVAQRAGGAMPTATVPAVPPPVDCLSQPAVAAEVERRAADEARQAIEQQAKQRQEQQAAHNGAMRRMLEQAAGLSSVESQHLADLVCAAREIRTAAAQELIAQGTPPGELRKRVREERRAMVQDLAGYLGRDRFAQLALVDGAALMAGSIECEGSTAP